MSKDRNVDKTSDTRQPGFLQPTDIVFKTAPPMSHDPAFDFIFTGDSDVPFETGDSRRNPESAK